MCVWLSVSCLVSNYIVLCVCLFPNKKIVQVCGCEEFFKVSNNMFSVLWFVHLELQQSSPVQCAVACQFDQTQLESGSFLLVLAAVEESMLC